MILREFEEKERSLNAYYQTLQRQHDRASRFYVDVAKFEDWYPSIESELKQEESQDRDLGSLKKALAHIEVFLTCFILCLVD